MNLPSGVGHVTLRSERYKPVIRSDSGLVFQSRRFREMCRDYGFPQEFVTPSTPEQNGAIERFFRSLKEECVWSRIFGPSRKPSGKLLVGFTGRTREGPINLWAVYPRSRFG